MFNRVIKSVIMIAWYSTIAFLFCLSMVMIDNDKFVSGYVAIAINITMLLITAVANQGGKKCGA